MSRTAALLAVLWLALTPMGSATAEIFRWTDATGREHFTTDLSRVPSKYRGAAREGARQDLGQVNTYSSDAPASNVGTRSSRPAPDQRRPTSGGRRASGAAPDAEKVGGHDEAWWRTRATRYRQDIAGLDAAVGRCQGQKAPIAYNPKTGARTMKRQHYERQMAAVNQCSQSRASLDATRRQQANFEESARRKGVPPGWLR